MRVEPRLISSRSAGWGHTVLELGGPSQFEARLILHAHLMTINLAILGSKQHINWVAHMRGLFLFKHENIQRPGSVLLPMRSNIRF